MAKNAAALSTLKDCLQFLEWLRGDKLGKDMQGLVAHRLERLLEDRYKTVSQSQIASALSNFLSNISKFHTKLCASPRGSYNGQKTAKNVLNNLIACIPKLLSAVYFLRYQVDPGFAALGGGEWKDQQVGVIALYAAIGRGLDAAITGPLDKYLIAPSHDNQYGVIPGGFDPSELRQGHLQGYSEASQMAGDLIKILDKETNAHNLFRDVYSTTVIPPTFGADTANVANAVRLVQDFCGIFGGLKSVDELRNHLYRKDRCINLQQLKDHCAKLKTSLGTIFKQDHFSFTGYGRKYEVFVDENIAKKMASWLRKNLHTVKEKLAKIKAFRSVNNINKLKSGKLQQADKTALHTYFTQNFIPYGFTFYGNHYTNKNAPYGLLQTEWDRAINDLNKPDEGLAKLVKILNGEQCQLQKQDEPEDDEEALEEPPDVELKENGETEILKPNPPKPVATKAEAAKPTATKDPEGAQNQGKKGEGTPTQNNDQSKSRDSPIGKSADATPPPVGGVAPGPPGPPGPVSKVSSPAPASPVVKAVKPAPPAASGAAGPEGPKGDQGSKGPPGTGSSDHSPTQIQTSQQTVITPSQGPPVLPPPPAALPSAPATPSLPGLSGVTVQGSPAGDAPTIQPAIPQVPVSTQRPSVSGPSAASPGDQGTRQDSGQGVGQQVTQVVTQPTSQASGHDPSSGVTTSVVPAPGGAGAGGGGKDSGAKKDAPQDSCPSEKGLTKIKLWPNGGTYCVRDPKPQARNYYGVNDTTSDELWEQYKQREILQPWQDKIKARRREKQDKERKKEDERQLQYQSMLPGIEVAYKARDGSAFHLEEREKLRKITMDVRGEILREPPDITIEIPRPVVATKTNDDDMADLPTPLSSQPPAWTTLRGAAVTSDSDYIKYASNKPLPPVPPVGVPMGHAIEPPKLPRAPKTLSAPKDMLDVTGQPITHTVLVDVPPLPPRIPKPPNPVDQYPPSPVKVDTQDMTKYLGVSDVILTKSTGSDIAVPPPHKVDTPPPPSLIDAWTIPNPKRNRPVSPPPAFKLPKTPPTADVKIPSIEISPDSRIMTASMLDVMGSPTTATNTAHPLPPLSALNLPWQRDDTVSKMPPTVTLNEHDMADITHVTGDVIKTPMAQLQGHPNMGISVTPELTGQPVAEIMFDDPDIIPIELVIEQRHETEAAPNAQIEAPPTATQGFTKQPSRTTAPPVEWLEPAAPIAALPEIPPDAFTVSIDAYDNVINTSAAEFRKKFDLNTTPDVYQCQALWYAHDASHSTDQLTPSPPPDSDQLPTPNTVREMLLWLVGLNQKGYIAFIEEHLKNLLREYNNDVSQSPDSLEVTGHPTNLTATRVANTLTEACLYSANFLYRIKHKDISDDFKTFFKYQKKYAFYYSSDPACLLCQLRDYVYVCHHQLTFLKSQCSRNKINGGWQDCQYGNNVPKSPLQAFLTDASDSKFDTHLFDPCNICLKSRVNMGFTKDDLPENLQTGKHISTILSPTCGGEDPLLTLASYLNCLTRRTPRTTGELVSFFHNFGNSLHDAPSKSLSPLGSALSKPHAHCPDWDHLEADDLQTIQDARGSAPPTANSNHDHYNDHPKTLSTLLGCGIDNAKCPQHFTPITYRAYALYSSSFTHNYLSWTAYLPDRLWESLLKLQCDLEDLQCPGSKCASLHQCDKALPLLYTHGFTPPDGALQPSLTCSKVISKLEAVVAGKPIASLMTAMDTFLYNIRTPFLLTIGALWLTATLYILHSLLYRMDVLRIRSHLLTTRASHLIDVKALLAGSRRMLSLYKDVDYFDDEPMGQLDVSQ
ncbi:ribosome binding protein [Babesia ovata]|uniref:Ribosome binding protein n=1 Tax=Babesia ovata TaxID=189622 RepID=A0A2H6KDA1_9APIC|nr:ribosome binding protein [Babesia ovata]GBE60967.1 ribosome binding protein [Babesia ovata]